MMRYMKRIGLVLALTLFSGSVAFSAEIKNDAAVLLEEAIYTEETLGDFDKAASIYRQIADNEESGRAPAAQALYRLGMYYQARGREAEAKAAFTRLSTQYPEQKELISRVPGISGKSGYVTQFIPAPWEDGEMLTYGTALTGVQFATSGIVKNITLSGTQLFIAESVSKNGIKMWQFRSMSTSGNSIDSRNVLAMDDNTFAPIERWSEQEGGERRSAEFFTGRAVVSMESVNKKRWEEFRFNEAVYDKDQFIYLLRSLPLQTGFETIFSIFGSSGSVSGMKISVEGREPVTTPAGIFNAWKIACGEKDAKSYYWISDDNRRYPVKMTAYPNSESVTELVSISKIDMTRPVEYADHNIRFFLPPGWFTVTHSMTGGGAVYPGPTESIQSVRFIRFVGPEFETGCGFTLVEYSPEEDWHLNLSETARGQTEGSRLNFGVYDERPGTREDLTISGGAAIRYIVDQKSMVDGRDIVTYVYLAAAGNKSLRGYFRTDKEDFDRFQPVIESIIRSIQLRWQ
jgi:tetratricopeptide (TPR) repeat protein